MYVLLIVEGLDKFNLASNMVNPESHTFELLCLLIINNKLKLSICSKSAYCHNSLFIAKQIHEYFYMGVTICLRSNN